MTFNTPAHPERWDLPDPDHPLDGPVAGLKGTPATGDQRAYV